MPKIERTLAVTLAAASVLAAPACRRPATPPSSPGAAAVSRPPATPPRRVIRATGTIQAVRAHSIQVPQIAGQGGRMTLIKLAPNGAVVKEGDILAEFDRTAQLDIAREAQAKFEDLTHQARQKAAENRAAAEMRAVARKEAEADLGKALIEERRSLVRSEIMRLQAEALAAGARVRFESLEKINRFREAAEAAGLRIVQLQAERQKVALERARANAGKLVLRAPLAGMVALENVWRSGSMGNAQEGDQLWQGQSLLKIFDPSQMEVQALLGEPDGAVLTPTTTALVSLDAYPEAVFRARFHSASPVATAALGSPIKNFPARFRIEQSDPRLLPDISAAVVIQVDAR
jgi:multidrug resistance efflux pump